MPASKPWEHRADVRRLGGTRERRRVLIVCEDSKSSCDYFKSFKVDRNRVEVVAEGRGMNTDSLVKYASRRMDDAERGDRPYNQVWCVFDRDDFPLEKYDRAFQLARVHGIKVAWANEAFELWYLLHFNYHDSGISRHDYKAKLKPCLGFNYVKSDKTLYAKLRTKQEAALKHARRLEQYWNDRGERFPERHNPSTSVHKLVEFLNELAELGSTG